MKHILTVVEQELEKFKSAQTSLLRGILRGILTDQEIDHLAVGPKL